MKMVGNVQFSLYGRGRHGSLRTGAVPASEAGHALGRRVQGSLVPAVKAVA